MKKIDVYEIDSHGQMDKDMDRLVRKKRFLSLPAQIKDLAESLQNGDFQGEFLARYYEPVECEVYKLRLPNPDANVGKVGGYRLIYVVATENRIVILLTIYYKKEQESISDTYIKGLIAGYFLDSAPYDEDESE